MPSTLARPATDAPNAASTEPNRLSSRANVTGPTPSARISLSHLSTSPEFSGIRITVPHWSKNRPARQANHPTLRHICGPQGFHRRHCSHPADFFGIAVTRNGLQSPQAVGRVGRLENRQYESNGFGNKEKWHAAFGFGFGADRYGGCEFLSGGGRGRPRITTGARFPRRRARSWRPPTASTFASARTR